MKLRMARVFFLSVVAVIGHTTEGSVIAGSPCTKSRIRITESNSLSRIWSPSANDRSWVADHSFSRSRTRPHYLLQGFTQREPVSFHETGHGMVGAAHHRPDPLLKTQYQTIFEFSIQHNGSKVAIWPEANVGEGDKQNATPRHPIGTMRGGTALKPEIPPAQVGFVHVHALPRSTTAAAKKALTGDINAIDTIDTPDPETKPVNPDLVKVDSSDLKQIFIRSTEGRHFCVQIRNGMSVLELKKEIQIKLGTPLAYQNMLFSGLFLQDQHTLQHYRVAKDSTIILNLRLRGGSKGACSKTTGTFRDAVKGKEPLKGKESTAITEPPGQYIVDQIPESPSISMDIPEVNNIFSDLQKNAVICRFNGFWPRTDALYQWIHTVWTKNCQIYLYPKGFFIVCFHTEEEKEKILNQGPWFWGSAGLFVNPWFPDFDANTMVVSRMPVWVRMHNLPLHFWHSKALIAIGKTLKKMLKIDVERHIKGIFTFSRICVEVDLSRGLPESITLNFNNSQWKQSLDYENAAFRCRGCQQTGHLYNACQSLNKNKPQQRKPKGWQNIDAVVTKRATEKKEHNTAQHKDQDNKEKEINEEKEEDLQLEISGNKRSHSPEGSDSDKEQQMNTEENQLAMIASMHNTDGWRKVEKKKGRKT